MKLNMLTKDKAIEYIEIARWLKRCETSVRFGNKKRFEQAEIQAGKCAKSISEIKNHTNDFLKALGMDAAIFPKMEQPTSKEYRKEIRKMNLENQHNIIWMKFTKDGFLGVVAVSNDINFCIPPSATFYAETRNGKPKNKNNRWKYNTSGIIVHHLKKEWNEDFILVFPLKNFPIKFKRGDIERGIGNYLIDKGVPILDYYSHMF
ncbi:MAG: hypothetical protein FWB96_03735 [Defluviitaleaceae bacterium]|nr:hypothetical protein [Defluviitaleaceae bacterium]MCL2262136.1 hypothetical protein [Defluviitaleaceae bacterium]